MVPYGESINDKVSSKRRNELAQLYRRRTRNAAFEANRFRAPFRGRMHPHRNVSSGITEPDEESDHHRNVSASELSLRSLTIDATNREEARRSDRYRGNDKYRFPEEPQRQPGILHTALDQARAPVNWFRSEDPPTEPQEKPHEYMADLPDYVDRDESQESAVSQPTDDERIAAAVLLDFSKSNYPPAPRTKLSDQDGFATRDLVTPIWPNCQRCETVAVPSDTEIGPIREQDASSGNWSKLRTLLRDYAAQHHAAELDKGSLYVGPSFLAFRSMCLQCQRAAGIPKSMLVRTPDLNVVFCCLACTRTWKPFGTDGQKMPAPFKPLKGK